MKFSFETLLNKLKNQEFGDIGQADPVPQSRKIAGTHWVKLPNVEDFHVRTTGKNTLFEYFELQKSNRPLFYFVPYRNGNANAYMKRQIKRLRKLKSNPTKFFRVVEMLMKNSMSFRVSAINKTMERWYKEKSFEMMFIVNRNIQRILDRKSIDLKFKRVYIPKQGGKWRPLGVPCYEWRIVLQMINNFLYIFLESRMLPQMHAYIPKKGAITAWRQVFSKINKMKYVYEYDLTDYFNQVNLRFIRTYLADSGIPEDFVSWVVEIHRATPILPETLRLPETATKTAEEFKRALLPKVENLLPRNYKGITQAPWHLNGNYKGVPQGSNTGPLLSLLPLIDFLQQEVNDSYADDGLFYKNSPFQIHDDPSKGVKINYEKSRWVKWNGKWQAPLKFLGLVYDGKSLWSDTRKGNTLLADGKKEIWSVLSSLENNGEGISKGYSWEKIMAGKYSGTLLAKLYSGEWNSAELQRQGKIDTENPRLWINKFNNRPVTFYNASSLAVYSLMTALRKDLTKLKLKEANRRKPKKSTSSQDLLLVAKAQMQYQELFFPDDCDVLYISPDLDDELCPYD